MSEPQTIPTSTPTKDLDARIAALEEYIAEPPSPSPSLEFVGGTMVHISHVGSFNIPHEAGSWAGVAMVALIVVAVLALFLRRRSKTNTRAV